MRIYNLGFIPDNDIYNHVKDTFMQYQRSIGLKRFNKSHIDPVKLTFDSKMYNQSIRQASEAECVSLILIKAFTYLHSRLMRTLKDPDDKCLTYKLSVY